MDKEIENALKTLERIVENAKIFMGKSLVTLNVNILDLILIHIKNLNEELNQQKAINEFINHNNIEDKYEEALEKVMTKFLNANVENDFVNKKIIIDKIKELEEVRDKQKYVTDKYFIAVAQLEVLKLIIGEK